MPPPAESPSPEDNPWTTQSSAEIYDNRWIRLVEHRVLNPRGKPGIYATVHFKNLAIGILPLESDGSIYLVGQYRYPLRRYSWEIPEGGGASAEAPLVAAQRELIEETGLVAAQWRELLELHLSNSVTDERAICFLAWGLEQRGARPEEVEQLQLRRLHFSEALALALQGEITDAISVAAILKVQYLASQGQLPAGLDKAVLKGR